MKHVTFSLLPVVLALTLAHGVAYAQSEPTIALPPAEVILKAAADMGVEAVDAAHVLSKMPELLARSGKVFVIDARPSRNYDDGHIPTAYNMYDAKFERLYPDFEKLNVAKDAEIFVGIGRPCPMSLNDIKQLKAKGYTNLKAFVKGPVFFEKHYFEVTAKGAKKSVGNGAAVINLAEDPDLVKFTAAKVAKDKPVIVAGDKANAAINYAAAAKVRGAGYGKTAVFNGDFADMQ
ncbi:MAG: rhodanese-like domain-containing protein [Rubrivivax sp.]|nr:rhodanese-like domain-containing protein [Rubrivivax sp.]